MRKMLAVRLDEQQIVAVKHKALDTGITVTEVVERLLAAYLADKIKLVKKEASDGSAT